ncbi:MULTISPECIES: cation diffusion facilitator family transporter [Streptomyces]|uniref:cation diffusion facilitator family transporter n=1 Tax=Streptomyces TaxID=1883 RepID=UPI0001D06A07|nr:MULTISPECIES: cation diffusion facilitator family transporter [Streptomyces]MYS46554.1 cation diffusion facilitator family transporter [Streptomyces sp. SID5998]MYX44969.1 cation diffusion facilitator family transporter [Streptomyces sp. SID89]NED74975.1 cation transporter [Streptomyces sp. SID9944]EFF94073.1 cobalt-zinc-cadmium efflux permease [Streptomyces sp. e14]MBY8866625.1 cation diffusion facilitator family transporter [Streptomyces sennicomposti]
MGAGHDHAHGHTHGGSGTAAAAHVGTLRIALSITLAVTVVEIVGGLLADSLALVADAAHMATDALGLGMALFAIRIANRPPSRNRTFGLARAEILAALANCLLLLGVGGYVLFEAIQRFVTPADTHGGLMIVFGLIGLVANSVSLTLLMRGQKESLNVRGAFLEVAADALGSLAVMISAAVILLTGWRTADPIASLAIGLLIVPRTVKLLRETLDVLLEAAPKNVDMDEVRAHILALDGVEDVHDLHAWTITSGLPVLSAHVVVSSELLGAIGHEKLLHELQGCLGDHFDVEHCTFQLEPSGHAEHEAGLCH